MTRLVRLFGIAAFAAALFAAVPALADTFPSFDQTISVNADSSLTVREKIDVNFTLDRHGIFRDIPVRYTTDAGNPFSLRVKINSVTDGSGAKQQFSTSTTSDGRLRVQIGDPSRTVTGLHTYIVDYTVSRALLYLSDHDELYWNVIAEPWTNLGLPEQETATVLLPKNTPTESITARCIVSGGSACDTSKGDPAVFFSAKGALMTIVVGWPKGITAPPTAGSAVKDWLRDNWIIFYPLVFLAGLIAVWRKKGREPERRGPLVVQYDPPNGASPGEVGVLFDQRADMVDVTSTIVHLAVKGYLVISETETQQFIGKKIDYAFELKKDFAGDIGLSSYERTILDGIFDGQKVGASVSASSLQNKFYTVLPSVKSHMYSATVMRGWFAQSPDRVRATYLGIGMGYLVFAYLIYRALSSALFASGPVGFVSVFAPGVLLMIFAFFMPARTRTGADAYAYALGFKEYLAKAEKYRLQWQEKEKIFETFLPYAMVFGVVDKWAKAFEGIAKEPPSWYHGVGMPVFNPVFFSHSLTMATASIGRSLAVAPSSRGGGGFGGGGHVGGGFGGGGGGSW